MSVHYKFKSALSFDTIPFDGLHISVRDLKKAILQQKQIGKASDFDLQITNAQSNEVYEDDNILIPKNSSLIVVRVPLTSQQKKAWEKADPLPALGGKNLIGDPHDSVVNKLAKTVDLANVEASEADKIQAAIAQSTLDYDPSNYLRIKGSNQFGEIPANYRCHKCMQPGHWIKDCKLGSTQDAVDVKKSTGIPRSFMVPVEGPQVPGAMMTPTGHYAVPTIDHEARKEPMRKPVEPVVVEKPQIPSDLLCGVCNSLLNDAVLIPCCGNSFCDECIRNVLLESEDHQCPDCREKDVSPDTLIPNRFLRSKVNTFRNQTGYTPVSQPRVPSHHQQLLHSQQPPPHSSLGSQSSVALAQPAAATLSHNDDNSSKGLNFAQSISKRTSPSPLASTNGVKEDGASFKKLPAEESRSEVESPKSTMLSTSSLLTSEIVIPPAEYPPPGVAPVDGSVDPPGQPIRTISVCQIRPPLNTKHFKGGSEVTFHKRVDVPPHFIPNHERSSTPTVDEISHSIDPNQQPSFPITSLGMPPRMMVPPMNQPPMFNQGNFMYQPRNNFMPVRPDMGMAIYPPGVEESMRGHFRGGGYRPRMPRGPFKPPYQNNPAMPGAPIDNPVELFNQILREKDKRKARFHRTRSFSRSFSRSPSPRPRSRVRSRSRTRSRSRSLRSRSRSRSRSAKRRRSRTRSRSLSISRSRSRSFVRSRSRSREPPKKGLSPHGPHRRRDFRSPPRQSPIRYYSQKYKEDNYQGGSGKGERERDRDRGRARYGKSSSDHYHNHHPPPLDYPRHGERYDSRYSSRDKDRDRDRSSFKDRGREVTQRTVYEDALGDFPSRYEDLLLSRDLARDWERTRDREIQLREKERQAERDFFAADKSRKREESRGRTTGGDAAEASGDLKPSQEEKKIISPQNEEPAPVPDTTESPEKEKKAKDKKKRKKEETEKKKKKKKTKEKGEKEKKDSRESAMETASDSNVTTPLKEGELKQEKPEEKKIEESLKEPSPPGDDGLYSDLGANVDLMVVETYKLAGEPTITPPLSEEKPVRRSLSPPSDAKSPPVIVKRSPTPPKSAALPKNDSTDKNVVLAPLPELSRWEKEEDAVQQPAVVEETPAMPEKEEARSTVESGSKQVTTEVLKRAENAIFKKVVNPLSDKKSERRVSKERATETKEKEVSKEHEKPKEERKRSREKSAEKHRERDERQNRSSRHRDRDRNRERDRDRDRNRDRDRDRDRGRDREKEKEKLRDERRKHRDHPKSQTSASSSKEPAAPRSVTVKSETADTPKPAVSDAPPQRISAKERLGAKVDGSDNKLVVKREVAGEKREVKVSKPALLVKNNGAEATESAEVVEKPAKTTEEVVAEALSKKRSVSLESTNRVVKKIKPDVDTSSEESSSSSDSEKEKKRKKKKKKAKKHKKKKKKRGSSSESDSSSSTSDSGSDKKKKKHKRKGHKKSKKKKKSKK